MGEGVCVVFIGAGVEIHWGVDALGGRDGMVGGDTEVEGALCGGVPVWWVLSFGQVWWSPNKRRFLCLNYIDHCEQEKIEKSL